MIQLGHRLMKASNGIGHKFGAAAHVIGHKYIPQVVNGLNTALTVASTAQKVKNLLTRGR